MGGDFTTDGGAYRTKGIKLTQSEVATSYQRREHSFDGFANPGKARSPKPGVLKIRFRLSINPTTMIILVTQYKCLGTSEQSPGSLLVGDVGGGGKETADEPLLIDDGMELEAIEHPHAAVARGGFTHRTGAFVACLLTNGYRLGINHVSGGFVTLM